MVRQRLLRWFPASLPAPPTSSWWQTPWTCCAPAGEALDGGLDIPYIDERFAGFKKDDKLLDAVVHRKYIYGKHVADYLRALAEEEPEKYQSHFSEYIKRGIEDDGLEVMYKKVHGAIPCRYILQ
ncbi:hypothetical protein QYE76_047377 [Lolium multiflorum]|uniref:60S ribosomal protein L5 n=1 Tax=Lolium multiflorum TaxID=4521 RepID=A0AAD8TNP5_LOLMU|nr:hypothetical protein QYE76_047377 [Lolium multiflorum]